MGTHKETAKGKIKAIINPATLTNNLKIEYDEYQKWKKVIFTAQLIIAFFILLTEIVCNTMLYVTRSQGYGPETIVTKLLRYLVLTTIINFGLILFSQYLIYRIHNLKIQGYILIISTVLMFTDICWSHYQFSGVFITFAIPLLLCILFEDKHMLHNTLVVSFVGLCIGIFSRAKDPLYNQDIAPEATISIVLLIAIYFITSIVMMTLVDRRKQLENVMLSAQKVELAEAQSRMSLQMLETLAKAIDAKDRYTNGHSLRVANYSIQLAEKMGMDKQELESLKYEALLHDIGKIGIPDSVLNKPGRLSDLEFKLIQTHTTTGADILKDMVSIPGAATVARSHHERIDGKGYPDGLRGKAIPLHARIIGIADSYDAMNSDRIYRKALAKEVIIDELKKGRGTQFDEQLLDLFLEMVVTDSLHAEILPEIEGQNSEQVGSILHDIEKVFARINHQEEQKDLATLYDYMDQLGKRYNRTVEIVTLTLSSTTDAPLSEDVLYQGSRFMEIAVKKNIRRVDVYSPYSLSEHIIILLGAGEVNIDSIAKRIFYDFYQLADQTIYKLDYSLIAKGGSQDENDSSIDEINMLRERFK